MTEFLIRHLVKDSENTQDVMVRTRYGKLAGITGILCNLILCAAKFAAGLLSGSIAVMADALNNVQDAASGVITLIGFRISALPADERHPFGHARTEYISGLVVGILIVLLGFEMAETSIGKILHPVKAVFSVAVAAVLILSVFVKLRMAAFSRTIGRKIDSGVIMAAAKDSRNDALSTFAVLVSGIVSVLTDFNPDGWMGLAVSLLILWSGIGVIRDTLSPLLGEAPDEQLVCRIRDKILGYEGVIGTHDLLVHDYGPGRRFASAHVEMAARQDVLKSHDIIDRIERDFLESEHINLVIHYDPVPDGNSETAAARRTMKHLVKSIDPRLSIHDFRMEKSDTCTDLFFDVAVPGNFFMQDDELRRRIQVFADRKSDGKIPCHTCVTIDHSYAPIPAAQESTHR